MKIFLGALLLGFAGTIGIYLARGGSFRFSAAEERGRLVEAAGPTPTPSPRGFRSRRDRRADEIDRTVDEVNRNTQHLEIERIR